MSMKKGKNWALSCVAISAVVLTGISATTVSADDTSDSTTVTTQSTNNQVASIQSTSTSNQTSANQSQTTQAQQNNTSRTENPDVQDGGQVSDDFTNEASNRLGYASNFHIFANEATLNAHTNGNLAVGTLNGHVNFGTSIGEGYLNKDVSYVQNHNTIASSSFVQGTADRTNKVVFGENNNVDVSNTNRTVVDGTNIDHLTKDETYQDKNGNKYIDFAHYFNVLDNKSTALANTAPTTTINNSNFPDQNQRVINLDNYQPNEDNQIVINLDADVLTSGTPLTIYGLSANNDAATSVIINVDTKGQEKYTVNSQIKLIFNNGDGQDNTERPNQETDYFDDNHLLWNFYDSTTAGNLYDGEIDIDRAFQGSVLAPKATINVNQNLDGNIVADKVNVNAETHRWDLQDDTPQETEFERPVTIPGEAELPEYTDENNGSNIDDPDDEEEEDIEPDGDLEDNDEDSNSETPDTDNNEDNDEDSNSETPDTDNNEDNGEDSNSETPGTGDNEDNGGDSDSETPDTDNNEDNGGSTTEPDTDKDDDSDEANESDENDNDDQNLITDGSDNNKDEQTDSNLDEGILSQAVGKDEDESQTPDLKTTNEAGSLPQTGATSGILATITGIILIALGFLLKEIKIKKD
ncbi:collagen-binding domain-containing protein [Companilactobacillus alimentarius]|uniref:Uncharacterized protein n=2 Tax=Companilactobacillus alimentarius TaxID=1602 RepID=A0A2K9HNM4_9LACO|nr:collagen-binding domain-containing protein [Companilactobacillus alimentarius]AUI71833.1 hypothetical protein LA20249_06430 [Companilactobacillus alimentarius DSM 20249]KRK76902.1 cell surface protein [Companilactobacillus alimentarius DSM 20249]GEO45172.1 hypothetical protein LAL01_14040 [Companilactobacillus alimentarius]